MRNKILILFLSLILILIFVADIFVGSSNIAFAEIFKYFIGFEVSENVSLIISEFRLPKALTALVSGVALSLAGLQMQTVFRNPLAGPYVLGISSGASLGVAILILGVSPIVIKSMGYAGTWSVIFAAWFGAMAILMLILLVSLKVKSVMTILILGVLLGSAISSVVNILQYFGNEYELKAFVIWSMGSFSGVSSEQLKILSLVVAIGVILSVLSIKVLNVLLLGENYVRTLGVSLVKSRFLIFLSTSLLAGSVTAFCGPIGFIGIVVPHIARNIFRTANHRILIPASAILGGIIILASDIISQMPTIQGTLPINSVTAILGIPFIIKIIFSQRIKFQ